LCIVDARSHRPVELAPGRRTPLRVWVHVPCDGACDELSGLRVLLVADVLARTAELFGGQALVGIASSAAYGDRREAFERHAAHLGIRPIEEAPAGPADVLVTGSSDDYSDAAGGVIVEVGPVHRRDGRSADDPSAVRLALLAHAYHGPAGLPLEELAEAGRTLARWRHAMADWARSPSKPMCADVLRQARTGFEEDLDVPAVLGVLRWLEGESEMPDGAKFETFAHLDRVLGLELTRDVGSAYPYGPAR
jgi:hypothetical protein